MSILINKNSKVIVQGITGREGSFHTEQMIAYNTKVVGGVTPGKGGQTHLGVPVFNSVLEAKEKTNANVSCIFVPAAFAKSAMLEAIDAGIELIVCITEGVPVNDMIQVYKVLSLSKSRLIGPNCPGLISVEQAKVGIIPNNICIKGPVGVVSRSGTLTYEVVANLTQAKIGQTTCAGIGGDPILGTTFKDVLPLFEDDPDTKVIVMIGEIGGTDEEEACKIIAQMKTPVIGFISGRSAPEGKRMGHAGAIISGNKGTAKSKIEAMQKVNVPVADEIQQIVDLVKEKLK